MKLLLGLLLYVFALSASAREVGEELEKLPEHVKSVAGKVVVVADFEHPGEKGLVPLYIINRTDKVVELPSQDGDVYLKLEAKGADGKWKRVQPHAYSW